MLFTDTPDTYVCNLYGIFYLACSQKKLYVLNYMKIWTHFMYTCNIQLNFILKFAISNLEHDAMQFFQFLATQLVCKTYCITQQNVNASQAPHFTKETSNYNSVNKAFLKNNFYIDIFKLKMAVYFPKYFIWQQYYSQSLYTKEIFT